MKKRKNIFHFEGKPNGKPKRISECSFDEYNPKELRLKFLNIHNEAEFNVFFATQIKALIKAENILIKSKTVHPESAVDKATELFRWHLISQVRARLHRDQEDI